jgi:hypothetical protein
VKVAYGMATHSREINAKCSWIPIASSQPSLHDFPVDLWCDARVLFCPCNTPLTDISPCIAWHSLSASCRAIFPSALHFVPKTDPCEDPDERFNVVLANVLGFSGTVAVHLFQLANSSLSYTFLGSPGSIWVVHSSDVK